MGDKMKEIKGSEGSGREETSITWSSYNNLHYLWVIWLQKLLMGRFQILLDKLMVKKSAISKIDQSQREEDTLILWRRNTCRKI
jgi:hypothetical protein